MRPIRLAIAVAITAQASAAGPDLECAGGSQVDIGACVTAQLEGVDSAVDTAYGFAHGAAEELDEVTGRVVAVPALEAGQAAWAAYRDSHCDFVGATFGGGSGTGIAISGCRVTLGRARVEQLLRAAQ